MILTATTLHGLEEVLAAEIEALGGKDLLPGTRAVSFRGDKELLYRANYELRTALRILVEVKRFVARDEDELYQRINRIDWSEYLHQNGSFAIDAVTRGRVFRHSHYAALKTKDAIVDQFRRKTGRRPNVDTQSPDLRINLWIVDDQATLSLDSSGDPLFRRGYRGTTGAAPINEVLAAGMLKLANWNPEHGLLDPMCGSGTIACEAAMLASNTPAQYLRRDFGFKKWLDFDGRLFRSVLSAANRGRVKVPRILRAADLDQKAIRQTEAALLKLEVNEAVDVTHRDFFEQHSVEGERFILFNPPYGERMGVRDRDIGKFYAEIGTHLKHSFPGYQAWIISSERDAMGRIGFNPMARYTLFNGKLKCLFAGYELYAGSRVEEEPEN